MELFKSTLITLGWVIVAFAALAGIILLAVRLPLVFACLMVVLFLVIAVGSVHSLRMEKKKAARR